MKSDLGLNPSSDGKVIRIPVPPLTEERRKEFVKKAHDLAEHARTGVRQARRDGNDKLKKMEKDKVVSQDDERRGLDEVQKLHDRYIDEIAIALAKKEQQILEVDLHVPLRLPPRPRGPPPPPARGRAGAGERGPRGPARKESGGLPAPPGALPGGAERALAEIAGPAHNGMAAEVRAGGAGVAGRPVGERGRRRCELVVLLEDVQDPRNLGALLRVCEGAGTGRVMIRDRGSAPGLPRSPRPRRGRPNGWRSTDHQHGQRDRAAQGGGLLGLRHRPGRRSSLGGRPPRQGRPLFRRRGEGPAGSYPPALRPHIGLPVRGRVGSLNIATSAAAVLYEAVRQRTTASAAVPEEIPVNKK